MSGHNDHPLSDRAKAVREAIVAVTGLGAMITIICVAEAHTAFALACLAIAFPLTFILFDWLVLKGEQRTPREAAYKTEYYPNFRIWGAGLILGIVVPVVYLFSKAILVSLAQSSVKHQAISTFSDPSLTFSDPSMRLEAIGHLSSDTSWQNYALILVLTVALGLLVWGIVKICQSE